MKKITTILLLLCLLPLYGFAQETLQEKILKVLNDKTMGTPFKRALIAHDTITIYLWLPFEETMFVINDILLPFVEKEVKDQAERNAAKSYIYDSMSIIHLNRGEPEDWVARQTLLEKSLEFAELSQKAVARARAYRQYAYHQSTVGSIPLAHEYFYKAINLYESFNDYRKVIDCLYGIAENMLQIRDIAGLRKVMEQMQNNLKKTDHHGSLFDFYSVQMAYYSLLSEDYPEISAYNDSALMAARNTIHLVSNNYGVRDVAPPGFAYYNMALLYSRCYPERYDSIYYFLDRALELTNSDRLVNLELEICVYLFSAELHFAQKRYSLAEKEMLDVLSLLEEIKDYNSVVIEYSDAYKFLITYYETVNRPWEVVKYQKLLLENERKRYDNEKIIAMDDMLVKYEVEKHKEEIDRLAEQHKAARKISVLAIGFIAALLIVLLILIRLQKLRKKSLEQSAYESALLAELKHSELEHIKQRLEQKHAKSMIKKLTEWLSQSVLDKSKIKIYIQQLSELDVDTLEQGFLTAEEKISGMDMKYIICFAIEMDVKDMGLLFNVEPASIRTMRYRIKKKFRGKNGFTFLR